MSVITPITLDGLSGVSKEVIYAIWPSQDNPAASKFSHYEVLGRGEYEVSYLFARHPQGKVWRSMFIPTNTSGATGISITWWGKSDFVAGQVQIKQSSEEKWATVAKSKLSSSGYEGCAYVGRKVPLTSAHEELSILHDSTCPSISQLGFLDFQARSIFDSKGPFGIGKTIGVALNNIKPTGDFLASLDQKGFNVEQMIADMQLSAKTQSAGDVISGLASSISSTISPADEYVGGKKEKSAPVVDRESVYGGWGAFG